MACIPRRRLCACGGRPRASERALLVTDAMSAAGMPNGEYRLGGFPVQVADGKAMSGGALAGSVLTLDRALSNFLTYTGAALEDGLGLLTRNPAAMTGLDVASLHEGCKANLVAVDTDGNLNRIFRERSSGATN